MVVSTKVCWQVWQATEPDNDGGTEPPELCHFPLGSGADRPACLLLRAECLRLGIRTDGSMTNSWRDRDSGQRHASADRPDEVKRAKQTNPRPQDSTSRRQASGEHWRPRAKILVVESDETYREAMKAVLECRGFSVTATPTSSPLPDNLADHDVAWAHTRRPSTLVNKLRVSGFENGILVALPRTSKIPVPERATRVPFPCRLPAIEAAILEALPEELRTPRPMGDPYGIGMDVDVLEALLSEVQHRLASMILQNSSRTEPRFTPRAELQARGIGGESTSLSMNLTRARKRLAPFDAGFEWKRDKGWRLRR